MVIDELILVLGLDASKFTQGQKDALAGFKKTKEEARSAGQDIEAHGKKIDNFFTRVKTGVMGLAGALVTGLGVEKFTGYITTLDAAGSRLARTLEMNVEELSTWQGVARRSGGTAESMAGAMNSLSQQIHQFQQGMGSGPFLAIFNSLGISFTDDNRKLKTMGQLFLELNQAVQKLSPGDALARLTAAGIDQATINTILLRQLPQMLDEQKRISVTTGESAANAERLASAWSTAEQGVESFGRKILNVATPALVNILETVRDLLDTSPKGIIGQTLHWFLPPFFPGINGAKPSGTGSISGIQSALRSALGTRGDRNNNPGNIEYGPFARSHGATGSDGRFAIFPTKEAGDAAMAALLQGSYSGLTLEQIQRKWVGNSDPNYLSSMSRATGLRGDQVPNLADPVVRNSLMFGMTRGEGTHLSGFPGGGAGTAAAVNGAGGGARTSSSNVTIHKIDVVTQATDAQGVAGDLAAAIKRTSFAQPANYGQQ